MNQDKMSGIYLSGQKSATGKFLNKKNPGLLPGPVQFSKSFS